MKKKVIITGSSGLIGSFLKKDFIQEFRVLGIDKKSSPSTDVILNLKKTDVLGNILDKERPDVIVNAAAVKDLIGCQNNTRDAWDINVGITDFLADYAGRNGTFFVQISSDMIFDGRKGNYLELNEPSPINWYGATKYAAELLTQEKARKFAICRTAQVFGPLTKKDIKDLTVCKKTGILTNQSLFPYFVIGRLRSGKIVFAPKNISSPTPVSLLSLFLKRIIEHNMIGIFHTVGAKKFNRYKLALGIAKEFNLPNSLIIAKDDPTSYLRPKDVSLDSKKIRQLIEYPHAAYNVIKCIKKWVYEQKFF